MSKTPLLTPKISITLTPKTTPVSCPYRRRQTRLKQPLRRPTDAHVSEQTHTPEAHSKATLLARFAQSP